MGLSNLTVQIRATANDWSKDMKQIQRDGKALEQAFKPLKQSFADFGKPLLAAGAGISAAFIGMAKVAADYGDSIDQVAEKTGASAQELSKLKFAADQSNSSFEDVSTGLKFLAKNLFAAATGSKEQATVFKALGVNIKDASGQIRPINDVLLDVADRFKLLPDGAEKAALSMKLFGKQGEALIPLLNRGRDGITELGDAAQRSGLVLDAAGAKLGDQFNKAVDRVKASALGFSVSVSSVLLPTLTNLADKGTENIIWLRGWIDEFPGATKAVAGLAGVLVGAGGLLVGLSGVLAVAPSVVKAILLVTQTATSAFGAIQLLSGAKTYSDISAGISLIGETSLAAKLGLIGLAAAAGIAIGSLINMGIEALGLTATLDRSIVSILNWNNSWIGTRLTGQNAVIESQKVLAESLRVSSERLAKNGVIVNQDGQSLEQWRIRIEAAAKGSDVFKKAMAEQAEAAKKVKPPLTDADKLLQDLLKSMTAVEKVKDPFAELRKSFDAAKNPAMELEKTLHDVVVQFGAGSQDILRAYSAQIVDVGDKSKLLGEPMPKLIAAFYEEAKAFEEAKNKAKTLADAIDKLKKNPIPQKLIDFSSARLGTEAEQFQEDLQVGIEQARKNLANIKLPMPVPTLPPGWTDITGKAVNRMGDMEKQSVELSKSVAELTQFTHSDALVTELLSSDLDEAAANSKKFNVPLADNVKRLIAVRDATKQASERAKQFEDAWVSAIANLNTRVAESISDMIFHLKFDFKSLIDIAKTTAKGMLSAFLSGLIAPLTDTVARVGKSIASSLSKVLFGGGSGGTGGLISSILPSGIKTALGIGTSAVATGATATAGAAGTASTGGIGLGIAGLSGAATLGIGAAVTGAILLAQHFIGKGRRTADEFVGQVQNPFDKQLGSIVNTFNQKNAAGTLKQTEAEDLRNALRALIDSNNAASTAFAAQGKTERKVVDQATSEYTKNFGQDFSNLFMGFDTTIKALGTPTATDPTGATLGTPTDFASAVAIFANAVNKFDLTTGNGGAAGGGGGGGALFEININGSGGDSDPNGIIQQIIDATKNIIIPEITRELSLNEGGVTANWIRIQDRRRKGVTV